MMRGTSKLYAFTPKCRIIARHLVDEIKSGKYRPGDKIDSVITLSKRFGVGRRVVWTAFAILAKDNYIITEHGSGTYVNPQLKPGRFYRIGLFINRQNPMKMGPTITAVSQKAHKIDYKTVLGINFEKDFELSDWLQTEKQIDGVLIAGIVDEKLLKYPRRNRIPYVVIGNYDISPEHPQATTDIRNIVKGAFLPVLKQGEYKRIGLIVGSMELKANHEFAQGVMDAIAANNLQVKDELICFAEDDGYAEVIKLMEILKPDAIYVHDDLALGMKKYLDRHDNMIGRRPCILTNSWGADMLPKKYYDRKVKFQDGLNDRVDDAITKLIGAS
jgi:DNA-binding transcriptional regulator YhcF (GntR family)